MKVLRRGFIETKSVKAFDLDGTLVISKSKFPKNELDYELTDLAREIMNTEESIVIFTNQTYKKNTDMYIQRVINIVDDLQINCDVYIALDKNHKKPSTLMIEDFTKWYEMEEFLYVGDAAGRENDFSDSDRAFAHNANIIFNMEKKNIKVHFKTPEQYITEKPEIFRWKGFNSMKYLKRLGDIADIQKDIMENLIKQSKTMIITVGPPASGKTTFAYRLKELNPDLVIVDNVTFKKDLSVIQNTDDRPIIISRTNPSEERRRMYMDEKPDWEHIVIFWDDIELAKHNNIVRSKMGNPLLPNLVYGKYIKNLDVPTEYIPWKFDATFTSFQEMYYFMMKY